MHNDLADIELNRQWSELLQKITILVGKTPDMNALLFLIGVQELGKGKREFTKEQKQDLMHIATCKLLSQEGYYELEGHDEEGWPHWKIIKPVPAYTLKEQDVFLKLLIIEYFSDLY